MLVALEPVVYLSAHTTDDMERYNLLIALGISPAVLTETIWTLAVEHPQPAIPAEIHVVTTLTGERTLRNRLFDTPDEEGLSVWARFCREVLQLDPEAPEAPRFHIHVPLRGNGLKLDDIRTWDDDRRYAELCYRVVAQLCADPDAPRVVASIAGGRKTMSAHLLTAFSLYARPRDESIHVLVHPERPVLEDPTFFYPRPGSGMDVRIERVDLHLVRFRNQLEELARLHRGGQLPRTLQELESLPGLGLRPARPALVEVVLGDRTERSLRLLDAEGNEMAALKPVAPLPLVTLITLYEMLRRADSPEISNLQLVENEQVEALRNAAYAFCRDLAQLRPWGDTIALSRSISELNQLLAGNPLCNRYLRIHSRRTWDETFYAFGTEPPALRVCVPRALDYIQNWPFQHVPLTYID